MCCAISATRLNDGCEGGAGRAASAPSSGAADRVARDAASRDERCGARGARSIGGARDEGGSYATQSTGAADVGARDDASRDEGHAGAPLVF